MRFFRANQGNKLCLSLNPSQGNLMKIALVAPTGNIGSEIAREALRRGHAVTGIVRGARPLPEDLAAMSLQVADLFDPVGLAAATAGSDLIASAFGPGNGDVAAVGRAATALIAAARQNGIRRVIVVGGAGSLEVAAGVQLVDTPEFPAAYKAVALAHRDAFAVLRAVSDVDWTFFAPAALIGPGPKVGAFAVGTRRLLVNAAGDSRISYADYAAAFVDEIEQARYRREIVTAAYR
jgi:putative NADH-flavin reductase